MEYVTLNNGIKMPKLGYGVYQTAPEDTKRCVLDAIETGYRSIDTAQAYQNESGVGDALAECGLPREEFFLTTKVWITSAGKTILSHNKSQIPVRTLKKLMRSIEANSGQIIEKWIEQFGEIRYYC